jgi:hypothetical protein
LAETPRRSSNSRWQQTLAVVLVVAGIAVTLAPFLKIVKSPRGDFPRHVEFGRRLLADEFIYAQGLNVPYPPFWALAHSPFSQMPVAIAQRVAYPIGIVSLAGLITLVTHLSRGDRRFGPWTLFFVWSATLGISVRFVMRDFDECGPNLFLVTLSWIGLWCWTRGRDVLGGVTIALAIALKCTAGLFLLYFLWKRQWKIAATTAIASALFLLSPVLVVGVPAYKDQMTFWLQTLHGGATSPSPLYGVLGEDPIINKSLRSAMARYLLHAPQVHIARIDHPAYIDFLDLAPRSASLVIMFATLAVLVAAAWLCRRPVLRGHDPQLAWQGAVVSLATLLLSPITWGQHCVATLPALFLIFQRYAIGKRPGSLEIIAMSVYVAVVVVLNRWMFSTEMGLALESYRPVTLGLILLSLVTAVHSQRSVARPVTEAIKTPTRRAA